MLREKEEKRKPEERIKKTLQMVVKDAPCITFKKGNEI